MDVFAGSGCIGVSVLKKIKNCHLDFIDVSEEAIKQIKINLNLNKIEKNRYRVFKSDLFKKLSGTKYDFIFANPPYVALNRIKEVAKDVLEKEPHRALFAGKEGMVYIEKFLRQTKKFLKPAGKIFLEFDPFQKEKIEKILKKEKYKKWKFFKDQYGKWRYAVIK